MSGKLVSGKRKALTCERDPLIWAANLVEGSGAAVRQEGADEEGTKIMNLASVHQDSNHLPVWLSRKLMTLVV